MGKAVMNCIKQSIKEQTCDLDTPEYVEFLRELNIWPRTNIGTMIKRHLITD